MPDISALKITPEILGLIAAIDEFKGAWRALGTLAPDRLYALRKVAAIESIGSSTRICKTASNSVAAFDGSGKQVGIVFETASPFETPRLMQELVEWTREELETSRLHPLLVIAVFVVEFLAIHPFQDGNGRLSRILTTLLLLRAGYAYVPYSSVESIIERSKEQYYLSLRQTQATLRSGSVSWQPWILFFLRALSRQTQLLSRKVERERLVMVALPEPALRILEHAKEHGRVSIGDMAKLTGINRNTLKGYFKRLVAGGHLKMHGEGRGAWYTLGEGKGSGQ